MWPTEQLEMLLSGSFGGAFPILSLRTNKADVVVGVTQDVADELDASGEKWRTNGKYVSFALTDIR